MDTSGGRRELFWIFLMTLQGCCGVRATICVGPVCEYQLNVGLITTMTYEDDNAALHQVYLNGTQLQIVGNDNETLSPDDTIIADGFIRDVILFNGQLPGPTIEVMEGVLVSTAQISQSSAKIDIT